MKDRITINHENPHRIFYRRNGQDAGSLDEALEALDDVIDILAEYLEQ